MSDAATALAASVTSAAAALAAAAAALPSGAAAADARVSAAYRDAADALRGDALRLLEQLPVSGCKEGDEAAATARPRMPAPTFSFTSPHHRASPPPSPPTCCPPTPPLHEPGRPLRWTRWWSGRSQPPRLRPRARGRHPTRLCNSNNAAAQRPPRPGRPPCAWMQGATAPNTTLTHPPTRGGGRCLCRPVAARGATACLGVCTRWRGRWTGWRTRGGSWSAGRWWCPR